jgi:nucleoid DNA-binding protein
MIEQWKKDLKTNGYVEIEGFGVFELLPRRQGKTFCGFRNKEGEPRFTKRLRFKISKQLRNELCK